MDIALDATFSLDELKSALSSFFPGSIVVVTDDPASPGPIPDVFAIVMSLETPGFPQGIALGRLPGRLQDEQPRLIELARTLSLRFGCRTFCDGTGYGPTESPYWVILWDRGNPYLADDSETDAEPPGPLKVLLRLNLEH